SLLSVCPFFFVFVFSSHHDHRDLHSFPTRRSSDLIKRYIQQNGIRMVNFMYPAGDGRLKTLNFVINNQAYLDAILTCGERVDGRSEEHTSELQSRFDLVCRLLLENKHEYWIERSRW